MFDTYQEHLNHSAPCNSRFDGFDRGDIGQEEDRDQGTKCIGRMTSGGGYRVEIFHLWSDGDDFFEVYVDKKRVHFTEERDNAIVVARWWMKGCPA
jgi:hypothetical protein